MSADVIALLYLAAGVLFIMALRGLSSPETSRSGNLLAKVLGFPALIMASVNTFGGFLVTQRMLAMSKKREPTQ
jgi:NAD/NADP transhydrogenase beta subunit